MASHEVRRMFQMVVGLSEPERRRVLDDPALATDVRAEVESLLAFDADADHRLTSAVSDAAAALIDERGGPFSDKPFSDKSAAGGFGAGGWDADALGPEHGGLGTGGPEKGGPDKPGSVEWGPYRPIELIGTGGMGAVYLAERTDGEVQQRVAVKVLRRDAERPGSIERFLQERQLLASMNHPGIARLIDAGRTPAGQPYLVMDFVAGVPIDKHAATLDIRGRFQLFLRVCDAVSYAHRHLVIHRDLKPSNIMVDGSGLPKLLDFGIAKLLDAPGDRTHTLDRWLTPNYASPEQRRGEADTTATDVYSLGAVLHTMLTGRPPSQESGAVIGAVDARDNARIGAPIGAAVDAPIGARANAAATPLPAARVPSTVDIPADARYILRKALRAEPSERYASVDALANDIEALLAWRPVQARADDRWYRMRRFLRRHRTAAALVALIVVTLAAGFFVVNRERMIAERRFQQVRHLANQVLALDTVVRDVPGSTKAREAIVAISQEYLAGLDADAGGDPALSFELGVAYRKLAGVQGVPTGPNLGKHEDAGKSLLKAEALMQTALRASPADVRAQRELAEISLALMILADTDRRRDVALARAGDAADRFERVLDLGVPPGDVFKIAERLNNVALGYKNLRRYDECVRLAQRALALLGPQGHDDVRSNTLSVMADALRSSGDLPGALDAITAARQIFLHPNSDETLDPINQYNVLWREGVILGGDGQISLDRPEEAVVALQRAFDLLEAMAVKDPNDALSRNRFPTAARELGAILRHSQPERALQVYEHALRRLREARSTAASKRRDAQLMAASADVLRRLDRVDEAGARITQAVQTLRDAKAYPASSIALGDESETVLRAWADHLAETGDPQRAADVYQELLDKVQASHPDPEHDLGHAVGLSRLYDELSRLHHRLDRAERAASMAAARVDVWHPWSQRLPQNPYIQKQVRDASAQDDRGPRAAMPAPAGAGGSSPRSR